MPNILIKNLGDEDLTVSDIEGLLCPWVFGGIKIPVEKEITLKVSSGQIFYITGHGKVQITNPEPCQIEFHHWKTIQPGKAEFLDDPHESIKSLWVV